MFAEEIIPIIVVLITVILALFKLLFGGVKDNINEIKENTKNIETRVRNNELRVIKIATVIKNCPFSPPNNPHSPFDIGLFDTESVLLVDNKTTKQPNRLTAIILWLKRRWRNK